MALEAGADGYLLEEMTSETLIMALELVLRGETVLRSVVASLLAGNVAVRSEVTVAKAYKNGPNCPS
jgi:DNA-binding NarL/FixJ family response regulator